MQGKERNNRQVDEAFVSEAWASMNKMLDEALPIETPEPVSKKQNTKWLMLLLLLIGFSAGSTMMYWYTQSPMMNATPANQEKNKPTTHQPIANQSLTPGSLMIKPKEKNTKTTTTKTIAAPSNSPNKIRHDEQIKPLESSSKRKSKTPWSTGVEEEVFSQNTNHTLAAPEKKVKAITTSPSGSSEQTVTPITVPPMTTKGTSVTPSSPGNASELSLIAPLPPEALSPVVTTLENTIIDLPTAPKWGLGLHASAIRDDGTQEFGGYAFGLLVNRKLDNRFSLRSGLEWHHLSKTSNSNTTNNVYASNLPDIQGQSNFNLTSLLDFSAANASVNFLDYLKIPLQLSYKLNRHWRFHTGAHIAYLLSPIGQNATDANDLPPFESLTPEEKVTLLANTRSKLARQGLEKIDFGLQVGLGYSLTNRLDITANYNIGLRDFSDDEYFGFKEIHTNQYLQLGLNYFFTNQ